MFNEGSFEQSPVNFTAYTDQNGWFTTDYGSSYACTPFQLRVTAQGYITFAQGYYPQSGEGFPGEIPDEITITLNPQQS